jgi:multicomponent Na+:H+ antiporter subunit E
MRYFSLGILLFTFWLALSGHYTQMLIGIGVACSLLCVVVAARMGAADAEAHPVHLFGPALTYFPWLAWEIAKSAWAVARIIIHPKLPISPTMTVVAASQRTPVGIAAYANSITLTPGTITTNVRGNELTVHAIVRDGAIDLEEGRMDARVKQFEGAS